MNETKRIRTTEGHCWLTFKNKYTISIFNGFGSYSENKYNYNLEEFIVKHEPETVSATNDCEIAIINPEGEFCTNDFLNNGDDVQGYIKPDELADIIYKVKNYKEKNYEISNK